MKPHPDLIRKFLQNQCTDAESGEVMQYLKAYPEEMERYLPLHEAYAESERHLNTVVSDRMLRNIRRSYQSSKQVTVRTNLVRYLVAASVTGLIILAAVIFFNGKQSKEITLAATVTEKVQALKTVENTSAVAMEVILPDHSVATLYPHSSLQYLPAFSGNQRDVYLKGKGLFHVQKNASKPFTVYVEGVATTALGTVFLVSETDDRKVSVKLLTGSVKVWSQYDYGHKGILLRPGDEVIVNSTRFGDFFFNKTEVEKKKIHQVEREIKHAADQTPHAEQNHLAFKNAPLKQVFQKVGERFGVAITYQQTSGIKDKLFTGTFLENDSLEFICKTICSLQGLRYRMEEHTIIISVQ